MNVQDQRSCLSTLAVACACMLSLHCSSKADTGPGATNDSGGSDDGGGGAMDDGAAVGDGGAMGDGRAMRDGGGGQDGSLKADAPATHETGVPDGIAVADGGAMGPLQQSATNSRYFVDPKGNAVFLVGSHTWDDLLDLDTGTTPAAVDFTAYVSFLKSHGHNATILWRKDLPRFCGWDGSNWSMAPMPWLRPGPGTASDGNPKFDLTRLNKAFFDRLRARVQELEASGIYAIVELFDGNQLTSARCGTSAPSGDGYPFTGANNVNGVDDGYSSGSSGVNSVTMTASNAITGFQDAYVEAVIDAVNDLPNVLYEVAEEQPGASMTWWAPHVMGLVRAYEKGGTFEGKTYAGKPLSHPVGIGSLNYYDRNDSTLYSSAADWVAPFITTSGFPSNVPTDNKGKVAINDSDHALYWTSFLSSDGSVQSDNLRGYLWENITSGAGGLLFMDPYVVYWPSSPNRNLCPSPSHSVCPSPDSKYDTWRDTMGYPSALLAKLGLVKMTPQSGLSSTGFCLADNVAMGAEYLVYAPKSGAFTVDLSATTRVLDVEWLDPSTGALTTAGTVTGGSSHSFTAPFGGDAVLHLVDSAGHA